MRICSFLPSATEIVYTLGLGDQLYGVTRSCDYPAEALASRSSCAASLMKKASPAATSIASSKSMRVTARASIISIWRPCVLLSPISSSPSNSAMSAPSAITMS